MTAEGGLQGPTMHSISVALATHNGENYLAAQLDSLARSRRIVKNGIIVTRSSGCQARGWCGVGVGCAGCVNGGGWRRPCRRSVILELRFTAKGADPRRHEQAVALQHLGGS